MEFLDNVGGCKDPSGEDKPSFRRLLGVARGWVCKRADLCAVGVPGLRTQREVPALSSIELPEMSVEGCSLFQG